MDALYYVIICSFVVVCIMLVAIILLQSSQTGGMGAAIGGTAFNAAFGGQGADRLLVRITTILAVLFFSLAIALNVIPTPGSNQSNEAGEYFEEAPDNSAPNSSIINPDEDSSKQSDEN